MVIMPSPVVGATHTGNGFLGMSPTGKEIHMRVMDFYRCNDETIVENWVPMDVPHILLQMGVDIFGRMRDQIGQHNRTSASNYLVNGSKYLVAMICKLSSYYIAILLAMELSRLRQTFVLK